MDIKKTVQSTLIAASCCALFSCGSNSEQKAELPQEKVTGKVAHANLKPTKDNKVNGKVTFIQLDKGVKVIADVDGLTPGEHGFHIHEFGDCSAPDGSSAGGHYNPTNSIHAGPEDTPRHVGDLGNLEAGTDGQAHYERVDYILQLSGDQSIIGKSVIVHEDRDDFVSQPTGNAGARQACGVIVEGE